MSIYHLKNGVWCDYVEEQDGIKKLINGEWVDGASNESAPPISVHIASRNKFIQKYPKAHVTYTDTFNASGMCFTHTKSSTWGQDSGTPYHSCKAGVWESGAVYTGWTGIRATNVTGGKGNVSEIIDVKVKYNRRGVGNWEVGYPIALVLSNLTRPNVGGHTAHHSSKKLNTFYSDTNMAVCSGTNAEKYGTTTMNNDNAKAMLKEFLNKDYSILLGYKESTGTPFIGLYALNMEITYTCNINKAIFSDMPMTLDLERNKDGNFEMWIFDDELDMSYEEIIKHRELLGRPMIKDKDVTLKTK